MVLPEGLAHKIVATLFSQLLIMNKIVHVTGCDVLGRCRNFGKVTSKLI